MYNGQDAIARGMADRIETLDQTVARLAGNPTAIVTTPAGDPSGPFLTRCSIFFQT